MHPVIQNFLFPVFLISVLVFLGVLYEARWHAKYGPSIQAQLVAIISKLECVGARELRLELIEKGYYVSYVRFYAIMSKLVDNGSVAVFYEPGGEGPPVYYLPTPVDAS